MPGRLGAAGGGELDPRQAARPLAGGRGHGVRHRVRWREAFAGVAGIFCCLGTTWSPILT